MSLATIDIGSRRHEPGGMRRFVLVLAATTLGLVACTPGSAPPPEPESYVSLGDSFTAGPLIPTQDLDPVGCLRSDSNYPRVVAATLGLVLEDPSCSGATTEDMFAPQSLYLGGSNPPQLNALDAGTDVVTLGISGNDIGFTDIVIDCVAVLPIFVRPCSADYTEGGGDEVSDRIDAAAPKVDAVLDAINARAPGAEVFVVGYPAILPDTGPGCWPQMPIAYADVPYLRAKEKELNAMLATQASANRAVYVDTYTPSIGHDACQLPGSRWVEPVVPTAPAAPVHPNAAGMQGMAAVVAAAIQAG